MRRWNGGVTRGLRRRADGVVPYGGRAPLPVAAMAIVTVVCALTVAAVSAAGVTKGSASQAAASSGTVGAPQGITRLAPATVAASGTIWEKGAQSLMYSALTKYTPTGGTELKPDLAEKWTLSKDGKTYTFTLKQNLKYSNGNQLLAKHIGAEFQRRLNPATGSRPGLLKNIVKTVVPNARTIRFTLETRDVSFPYVVSTVFITDPSTLNTKPAPAGSGPYKLRDFQPDDHLTLVPNTNYYGTKAKLQTLNIVNLHDNTAEVTALRAGNLDAGWQIPFSVIATLAKQNSFVVIDPKLPTAAAVFQTDTTKPPFNDRRARQALAYAFDRNVIAKNIYHGFAVPAMTSQPVAPTNPYFGGKSLPRYPYDLAKSKALFNQAGVPEGSEITLWAYNTSTEAQLVGQLLQAALKTMGITLKIQVNDVPTWVARLFPPYKPWPNMISPNGYFGPYPESLATNWITGAVNPSNWMNNEFTKTATAATRTSNPTERKRLWTHAQRLFSTAQPANVIVYFSLPIVARSDFKGVWIDPAGFTHFEQAFRG